MSTALEDTVRSEAIACLGFESENDSARALRPDDVSLYNNAKSLHDRKAVKDAS